MGFGRIWTCHSSEVVTVLLELHSSTLYPFLYAPYHTVGSYLPCLGNYVVSYHDQKGQVEDSRI